MSTPLPPVLEPLPGFDWSRIKWTGPGELRTENCSYCGHTLDRETSVPLIMTRRRDGAMAELCNDCMVNWWGFEAQDDSHKEWREANSCG